MISIFGYRLTKTPRDLVVGGTSIYLNVWEYDDHKWSIRLVQYPNKKYKAWAILCDHDLESESHDSKEEALMDLDARVRKYAVCQLDFWSKFK